MKGCWGKQDGMRRDGPTLETKREPPSRAYEYGGANEEGQAVVRKDQAIW